MKDIFTSSNFRDLDEHINESEDSEALRKEFEDMTGEEFPYDPPSMSEICS
jgi:adenylylsulfate kinase-like enzyme